MAVNDVMFNIGINVNADFDSSETLDVVQKIQDTLNKNGITVPISLNDATIKQMDEYVQSLGGNMKITKDATTNLIESITVNVPKANGQMLSLNQDVKAVYNSITDANGVTQQFFSHFESNGITASINGMNTSLERVKELQDGIVSKAKERLSLEQQLADAIVNNDSKDQAALMQKINKAKYMENMQRDALSVLQQQSNALGQQVNYFETVNNQVSQAESGTAKWVGQMIQTGQAALDLARNLGQSKEIITQYFTLYQKMESSSGTQKNMLSEDLKNVQPQIVAVMKAMENLGATFDKAGAHYSGLNTGMQELVNLFNKLKRATDEFNARRQDQSDDVQKIEAAVQAYKAYRDQLDRINKLKKENATGVDMKAEQQQLDALKTSYKNLEQGILSNGEAVYKNTQYNRDKNQVTRDSIQAQKELNVTLQDNSLQDLIADTITYTFSLQSLQQVIQSVVSETISLNDSMTQIRLVTQDSAENTKVLMSDYSEIAKQLGTTTSAVADSAVEWLRQGNTVEETSELVKASTTLSVIGAMDASDATTALTASLNGYKMEAQDAMKIVDQLTTLDLKYATSSGDIANALSRVASSASAAGVPLERMEAIITVTADQTQQAAETIGRAWNSVIQRINKISAGKDVSDTGKSLNDVDKALKTVGISLRDDNGIIKASSDILDEVAAKWDTWNRNQQAQIATAIAGTNQANIFRATMNDYKEVLEATTIAENASGSATERMSIYTESLTGKINTFKTTWTELVNDLNLDSLIGTVVDLGTKLLEILNLLLNKIPVLSTALKALFTAEAANILSGAIIKALQRIAGVDGIGGLLNGLLPLNQALNTARGELSAFASLVGGEVAASTGGFIGRLGAAASAIYTLIGPLGIVIGLLTALGGALLYCYNKFWSVEAQVKNAKKALEDAQSDLDETNQKISDIGQQISEINAKGELTLTDEAEKKNLEEQLAVLKEIKQTQQEIVDAKNSELLGATQTDISKKYKNTGTVDEYQQQFSSFGNYGAVQNSTDINELIGAYKQLNVEKQNIIATNQQLAQSEGNNSQEIANNNAQYTNYVEIQKQVRTNLLEQKEAVLQDIQTLQSMGDTSSDVYNDLQNRLEEINITLDPSNWAELKIEDLISDEGLDDKVKDIVEQGGDTAETQLTVYAKQIAEKISSDNTLKQKFADAFKIDVNDLDIDTLTADIVTRMQGMYSQIAADAQSGFSSIADVYDYYAEQCDTITASTETLTEAFTEMTNQGYLNTETIQNLVKEYPELANQLEIEDGQVKINIQSLNDLANQYYETAIANIQNQIQNTQTTIDNIATRIRAYNNEITALKALAAAGDSVAEQDLNNAYNNRSIAFDQLQEAQNQILEASHTIDALRAQQAKGLQPNKTTKSTKKSGSSTKKTNPEKEAYELKKSEIELVQKQLELEKSKLEEQKKGLEQQKSGLELRKSEIELQKQQKEQQLDIIEDAEDGIDDIIELIKKMTKQDYENLKTKLTEVKDYIGDFKDALDDVKDTYDDLVDDAKDKLKAEKEAVDNQKKLEDGAKSIAEIQAQLAEIQYDDSADAQAKRLELTASLNEKQQDLEDEMKDQAYDAATDALDKTKDKVDNIFDAIGDILDASQDAIADYITYISDELESEGNLYQAAVAQFNDTSEGAQEELYNRLIEYNNKYGDSINKTVTEPWNEAIAAVEKYKEVAGSADIDTIRQYLGSQDTQLNASIKLDEQAIDGLDNQIDQIKIDMDKVDVQITQFEQAISQVKDALSQLAINYNTTTNASDAKEQGVDGTGSDYAYGLIKGLLQQAGVDTSTLPATYQGFVDALSQTTEAATGTKDALVDLTDQVDETTPEVEGLGDTSTDAGSQIEISGDQAQDAGEQADGTVQPLTDVATSGEQAAGALSDVAYSASTSGDGTGSSGSGFANMLQFLTGGDTDKFVQQFATKAISKYLPKLIKAGVSMIGKLHDGTDEVKKSNSWLDKMLGLGQDETARILKVGEAVIPDYANDAVQNMDSSAIRPTVTAPNTSNVKTTNNSELNIDMGDLDISGIDTTELRNELANIKKESANQVYSTLYRYIKVGGYRNVRNRYN